MHLFTGSDKRFYKNELSFDAGTLASEQLGKFKLNNDERIDQDLESVFS